MNTQNVIENDELIEGIDYTIHGNIIMHHSDKAKRKWAEYMHFLMHPSIEDLEKIKLILQEQRQPSEQILIHH